MKPTVLIACLSPIAIIWIAMKLAMWLYVTEEEREYDKEKKYRKRGPYLADVYADVDEEEEERWNSMNN